MKEEGQHKQRQSCLGLQKRPLGQTPLFQQRHSKRPRVYLRTPLAKERPIICSISNRTSLWVILFLVELDLMNIALASSNQSIAIWMKNCNSSSVTNQF